VGNLLCGRSSYWKTGFNIVISSVQYFNGKPLKRFCVQVLIVGGGDGGVAREVAKHPDVESIVQVEIDSRVLDVSKKFLPFMGAGLASPKLTLHVGDGFRFMAQHRQEFDVIITDSSDPVGMYMI
jgi:spermidine synthase